MVYINKMGDDRHQERRYMPKLFRKPDGTIKRECIECGVEKSLDKSFYKSNLSIYDSRMLICKDCLREIKDIERIKDIFKMNDIVFMEDIWLQSNQNISEYLKNLNLSQFKNLRWEDSNIHKNNNIRNIEMFDYQLEAKNKIGVTTTICNWSRICGKTFTLAMIILKDRPKQVLFIGKSIDSLLDLRDKFAEIFNMDENIKNSIKDIVFYQEQIKIIFWDNSVIKIYNYISMPKGSISEDTKFDYIMFNDLLPFYIPYKTNRIISMVSINNYNKKLERLYKHDTIILNEDYLTGSKNGLISPKYIENCKDKPNWFDDFAILDNPNSILKNTDRTIEFRILDTLYNEINCLTPKIIKTRENEEYGTYKNLILSYKEVLALINEVKKQYDIK